MSYFDTLPDEMIVEQCEKMDAVSLENLTLAYERMSQVCGNILQRKMKVYNDVTRIMNEIKGSKIRIKLHEKDIKFIRDRKVKTEAIKFLSENNTMITYDSHFNQWYFKFNMNYYPVDEQTIRDLLTDLIDNNEKIDIYRSGEWNWDPLNANPNWNWNIIHANPAPQWNWGPLLNANPNIDWNIIHANPAPQWNW